MAKTRLFTESRNIVFHLLSTCLPLLSQLYDEPLLLLGFVIFIFFSPHLLPMPLAPWSWVALYLAILAAVVLHNATQHSFDIALSSRKSGTCLFLILSPQEWWASFLWKVFQFLSALDHSCSALFDIFRLHLTRDGCLT